MNIAPFWSRVCLDLDGRPHAYGPAVGLGWSFTDQAEADAAARDRAERAAVRLRAFLRHDGDPPARSSASYYGSRPLMEPILEHYGDPDAPYALVTRTRYGARVLNAAHVMFVDMDLPMPRDDRSLWQRLTQVPAPSPDPRPIVDRARRVVNAHPGMGLRLYRTRRGFRGLVTDCTHDPRSDASAQLLEAFGSDPLFLKLCQAQGCFRARLTPKPWRVGVHPPTWAWFPAADPPTHDFETWLATYERACQGRVACHLVEQIGAEEVHPEVAPVLDLHDREAVGEGALA